MKNYEIRIADNEREREAAFALRRQVFVEEQRLFDQTDTDENDSASIYLNIWKHGTTLLGTVRCYPDQNDPTLWWGGRLAVHPDYRLKGIGVYLIKAAVIQMRRQGVRRFMANVQEQNISLFEKLGWSKVGELTYIHEHPHQLMEANLYVYDAREQKQFIRG